MSHRTVVLYVSAIYLTLTILLRIMVDATSENHRHVQRLVEYANESYEHMNSAASAKDRLQFASMALAVYTVLLETDNVSRVVIDRFAQCDVQRRRRRLQRTIEGSLVPTESVSSTPASV
jgi:ferritin